MLDPLGVQLLDGGRFGVRTGVEVRLGGVGVGVGVGVGEVVEQ
ncbi:hypothetical protein [Mycolicibacterium aromaticivorans]|nr:hypothetical protein [Mycolicibacterium aromaticivorans]